MPDSEDSSCFSLRRSGTNNNKDHNSLAVNASDSLHLNISPINTSLNVAPSSSNTNSENKNDDSVIANNSDAPHLSNSSFDIPFNIEYVYFDRDASDIGKNSTEKMLNVSFCYEAEELIETMQSDTSINDQTTIRN